ncbi:MAG TPA: hypothetical protein PKX36_06330 [Candidatus Cloacimonadota bacterium]|nr:hypothetical protein [Candidatus Cloacimonadota bacterium]
MTKDRMGGDYPARPCASIVKETEFQSVTEHGSRHGKLVDTQTPELR